MTIFQSLNKVLFNGNSHKDFVNMAHDTVDSNIIDTAKTQEEYQQKLLQAQQQSLLRKQWVKASYDLTNQSLAGLNNVKLMYREAELMDAFPEIGTTLDIVSEECCTPNKEGKIVNIQSNSPRIKTILEDLFVNRLTINTTLPMICRSTCKYGNSFMMLNIDQKNGVMGWKQLPVYEMERWENGQNGSFSAPITSLENANGDDDQETKFVWVGQNEYVPYRNWQVSHFRLLYDSIFLPYGCSFLNKARRHFRMLSMMEDMMLIYRMDRSVERRVFKINVGAIDEKDVPAYVQDLANEFKRKPIVDPQTGQIDMRKSFMNVTEDFFIPVRDDNTSSPIETLQGAQNLTAMDDIKFMQNKVFTALRVPKSFLNFDESVGDGKNLSLLDIRFTKMINRIQQGLLFELNKIAIIHLYLNGFQDELNNFSLTMNNPSSQVELLELDNLAKKITTAKDAVSDPGGGIPLFSMTKAWRTIFQMSDKEIQQNLEEIRLETALAAELQKTNQIIDRTGLFDGIDNIYGLPGASYVKEGEGADEKGDDSGFGGGGSFGGFGDDFGDAGEGDFESGSDGEMDMDMATDETNGTEDIGNDMNDSIIRHLENKVLNERKELEKNLKDKRKHYAKILSKRLIENSKQQKPIIKTPIYNQAFFLNEEMNSLKNNLETLNKE